MKPLVFFALCLISSAPAALADENAEARARWEAMGESERHVTVLHPGAAARESSLAPVSARERAKAYWSTHPNPDETRRILPVQKLSPVQQATKMRQEKHWNDLTPAEQAKRKAALKRELGR